MRLVLLVLRPIYFLLYHQFAWTYDLIASIVSLGRWQDWVNSCIPYITGRVLEIGFGPGHLQQTLADQGMPVFGLDESSQMARQARNRLCRRGMDPLLVRGRAQQLPFRGGSYDSVIATFPSEYIFDPQTLKEIWRVLCPGGRLIVLPMAWITGTRPLERLAAWLFRITGEAPGKPGYISTAVRDRFLNGGFMVRSEIIDQKGSRVLVILAEKGNNSGFLQKDVANL
jgi:ubiquinone/menaquinone biosynthesis C-methylase UbiE